MANARTAGLLIEVFPSGHPGRVVMSVYNVGPEPLTQDEAVRTLRSAADSLEVTETWRPDVPPLLSEVL